MASNKLARIIRFIIGLPMRVIRYFIWEPLKFILCAVGYMLAYFLDAFFTYPFLSKEQEYYLAMLEDHDGWHHENTEQPHTNYAALYRDSKVKLHFDRGLPGDSIVDQNGNIVKFPMTWNASYGPFGVHARIIRQKLDTRGSKAKRRKSKEERAKLRTANVITEILKKKYTAEDIKHLQKITHGESFDKLGLPAFARYLALHSDYSIRDFKVLLADFEMVPLIIDDRWQTMDLVAWRLEIGK